METTVLPLPQGELVLWAPQKQETGGKRAADANWIRTVPGRGRAALPRCARQELRAIPAELPPRLRAASPTPLPAPGPRRGLGGGRAATAPRSQHPPPARALRTGKRPGVLPAPADTGSGAARRKARPGRPQPHTRTRTHTHTHTRLFRVIRYAFIEGEKKTKTRNELQPGWAAGCVAAADERARTREPPRAPPLLCAGTNHGDDLRRLARYSPARDRPARRPPPAPPSYIRGRGGVRLPCLGKLRRVTRNQPRKGGNPQFHVTKALRTPDDAPLNPFNGAKWSP